MFNTAKDPSPREVLTVLPDSNTNDVPAPTINVLSVGFKFDMSVKFSW